MPLTIPNVLTLIRIMTIPLMLAVYFLPLGQLSGSDKNFIAALLFVFAAATDAFDGWIARRFNQHSHFGAFLDPVADKLMVCSALLLLLDLDRVDVLVALVIIGRELTVSALREWMATVGAGKHVAVHAIGKIKTIAQMLAIPLLLLFEGQVMGMPVQTLGEWLIVFATLLTVVSMVFYLRQAWPVLTAQRD